MTGLTDRQELVLATIIRHTVSHGFPPTIRELKAPLGIGSNRGVTVHLEALAAKGFISFGGGARMIRVLRAVDGTPLTLGFSEASA